jgi:hypothetical protein
MSKKDKTKKDSFNLGRRIALVLLLGWVVFSGVRTISALAYLQTLLTEHDVQEVALTKATDGSYAKVNGQFRLKALQSELQTAKFDVAREAVLLFLVPLVGWGIFYAVRLFLEEDEHEDEDILVARPVTVAAGVDDDFAADISGRPIGMPSIKRDPQDDEASNRMASLGITVEKG